MGAAPAPVVAYRLTPVLRDGALDHLEVRLSFAGDADGVTDVRLPDRWLGQERLHEAISEPVAQGARLSRPQPALLRLTHAPSAPVTLRYQVRNGRGAEPDVDYRPDLDARGFTALGETVLAWPAGRSRAPARAELGALPADWRSAGTLEQARTVEAVRESVTTAGSTVRVLSRDVGGASLRVAFRGRFRFTDEAAADALARVLSAQRGLSGAPTRPFTAVLQSLPQAGGGRVTRDGLGRGDGAVWFLSPDTPIVESLRIFAHEPLHAWLPRDVGGLPAGAQEPGGYWFSEGFADFLAFRSLVRSGDWSADHYASQLNLRIDPEIEAQRPVTPNTEIVAGFGRRPELFQVPYRRGHLLALLWDSRLREATEGRLGVDDVLRAMRERARSGTLTADALFPVVYRQFGGGDLSSDIRAHVQEGRPIRAPALLYGGCMEVRPPQPPPPGGLRRTGPESWSGFGVAPLRTQADRARCGRMLFGAGYTVPESFPGG